MSTELDLSPPEVPDPTLLQSLLDNGLFLGATVQLLCILAVIIPTPNWYEQEETEPNDFQLKPADLNKKSKGPVPEICQKLKNESKKKR
uniref:MANBAL n=1 Tax=Oncorhynchus mykiss TaxID=8022 RepID=A0A8C7RMR3_ONCMY